MRVLVTGATGMIGSRLVDGLLCAGHEVVLAVRDPEQAQRRWPGVAAFAMDFAAIDVDRWRPHLRGVDAVVNTIGIFQEEGSQRFDAVHVKGPLALFAAACEAGATQAVQLSALGAHPAKKAAYLSSKGRADIALGGLPLRHTIVQPSLVYASRGASTRWFAALAALTVTPLPDGGRQRIQPVHVDDLCQALVRLIGDPAPPALLHAVGPTAVSLRDYLATIKRGLGFAGGFVGIPGRWIKAVVRLLPGRRFAFADTETLSMLEAGSTAPAEPFARVLGRAPRPVEAFVRDGERVTLRDAAVKFWLVPALRLAVAAMWVVTAWVSVFAYPLRDSLALLARVGLHGGAALAALYAAAALDLLLGLLPVFAPAMRRLTYKAQLATVVAYTAIITVFLPEYWAHPYGPVLKNVPLLVAIALLHAWDTDGRPGR